MTIFTWWKEIDSEPCRSVNGWKCRTEVPVSWTGNPLCLRFGWRWKICTRLVFLEDEKIPMMIRLPYSVTTLISLSFLLMNFSTHIPNWTFVLYLYFNRSNESPRKYIHNRMKFRCNFPSILFNWNHWNFLQIACLGRTHLKCRFARKVSFEHSLLKLYKPKIIYEYDKYFLVLFLPARLAVEPMNPQCVDVFRRLRRMPFMPLFFI